MILGCVVAVEFEDERERVFVRIPARWSTLAVVAWLVGGYDGSAHGGAGGGCASGVW